MDSDKGPRHHLACSLESEEVQNEMAAGASARREYEWRKSRELAAIKRNLVWTVPLVIALSVAGGVLVERLVGSFGGVAGLLAAVGLGLELWRTRECRDACRLTVPGCQ